MPDKTWDELKKNGESHYKGGKIELVDLFNEMVPHPSLSVADVSALTSIMRYATRMLLTGLNGVDLKDIKTYAGMRLLKLYEVNSATNVVKNTAIVVEKTEG